MNKCVTTQYISVNVTDNTVLIVKPVVSILQHPSNICLSLSLFSFFLINSTSYGQVGQWINFLYAELWSNYYFVFGCGGAEKTLLSLNLLILAQYLLMCYMPSIVRNWYIINITRFLFFLVTLTLSQLWDKSGRAEEESIRCSSRS